MEKFKWESDMILLKVNRNKEIKQKLLLLHVKDDDELNCVGSGEQRNTLRICFVGSVTRFAGKLVLNFDSEMNFNV